MNTIEKLQKHLSNTGFDIVGYPFKETAPYVVCYDGTTLSVQASLHHYCSPRSNTGPYTHVEVWCVTAPVVEFDYDDNDPSSNVPIEHVAMFIDNHGGMKND